MPLGRGATRPGRGSVSRDGAHPETIEMEARGPEHGREVATGGSEVKLREITGDHAGIPGHIALEPKIDIYMAYANFVQQGRPDMPRTVSIFRNNRNQAIRLPKDFEFQGVTELTIEKQGDAILLRPVRPDWLSLADEPRADADYLRTRPDLIEEGRFSLDDPRER